MDGNGPTFEFRQSAGLLKATGVKARDLRGLREHIATASEDVLYHHTYQYFRKGLIREYTSDFAQWVGESLEERALSEQLSNIDPYEFTSIDDLRAELLRVIDRYLDQFPEPRPALPRDEFYFTMMVLFVFPAGVRVKNLAEFLAALKYVDLSCIYYHFFEARRRNEGKMDDFSRWIQGLGKVDLARQISAIDPFMHSLENIRERIVAMVEQEVRLQMEEGGTA